MREKLLVAFFTVSLSFLAACSSSPAQPGHVADVRLRNCFAKLREGKTISVVALGGSITTGHQARPPELAGWAGLVNDWFKERALEPGACKPGASVKFYNSGASGTDSAFASIRLADHVLAYNPDLVIVEYAVNDQWLSARVRKRSYEGVVRRLMYNSGRAVILLALNEKGAPGKSTFREQAEIAKHYNVPILAWAGWVKQSQWNRYFSGSETIHPNNEGHASIASGLVKFLNHAWNSPHAVHPVNKTLPPPLVSAEFQNVSCIGSNDTASIVKNSLWETKLAILPNEWPSRGGKHLSGWSTSDPKAELSVRVRGKSVGVLFAESDMFFNSLAWLEDANGNVLSAKVIIKNFASYRAGYYGYAYAEIADNLDPSKEYILRIGVNPGASKGVSTHIIGVLCTASRV